MSRKKYIDRIDLELLNTLSANPKMTVAELGEEIDLTPGPTHTRLVNLEKIVKNGAVVKEGFFKYAIEIDYTKFGIKEHVFSFELIGKKDQEALFDPAKSFKQIISTLSKAKESLITSIELLQDVSNNSSWVSINYFPRSTEETIKQKDSKAMKEDLPSDKDEIRNLLNQFINTSSKTLLLIKREEIIPTLDRNHIIRKKP